MNCLNSYLWEYEKAQITFKWLNENLKIIISHTSLQEITVNLMKEDESDGTKKLFGLLGAWIEALDRGSTIVLDELDIRLHSHLTRFLVELFHNPEINKNNAQLIFSTHDTNLLDQELFRRDQIWFVEKKEDNSTDLYSLDDFPVRKDAAIEKGYLQGKYGAIPYMKGDCTWREEEILGNYQEIKGRSARLNLLF